MIGPQIQKAIVGALKSASPEIAADRIYDRVPNGAIFPYVTVGDEQTNDDGDQCHDHFEVFADVHVWSRPKAGDPQGKVQAKEIGEAIRQTLTGELTVDDYHVIENTFEAARVFTDPDGITAHAVLTFRLLLQPE